MAHPVEIKQTLDYISYAKTITAYELTRGELFKDGLTWNLKTATEKIVLQNNIKESDKIEKLFHFMCLLFSSYCDLFSDKEEKYKDTLAFLYKDYQLVQNNVEKYKIIDQTYGLSFSKKIINATDKFTDIWDVETVYRIFTKLKKRSISNTSYMLHAIVCKFGIEEAQHMFTALTYWTETLGKDKNPMSDMCSWFIQCLMNHYVPLSRFLDSLLNDKGDVTQKIVDTSNNIKRSKQDNESTYYMLLLFAFHCDMKCNQTCNSKHVIKSILSCHSNEVCRSMKWKDVFDGFRFWATITKHTKEYNNIINNLLKEEIPNEIKKEIERSQSYKLYPETVGNIQ